MQRADQKELDQSLQTIQREAKASAIHVIVGAPSVEDGRCYNAAFVIDDGGHLKTRYRQIAPRDDGLFQAGEDLRSMWFDLHGVPAIVTVGHDANLIEIGDLAAESG